MITPPPLRFFAPPAVIEFMTGTGTMGMAMASPKEPGLLHRTSGPCYSRTSRPHSAVGALDANSTERQNQACMGNQEAAGASGANNTNSQLAAMNSGGSASANHRRGSTGGQGAIGALSQGQQGQGQQEMMGVEASDSSVAMLDALARKHEDVTVGVVCTAGYHGCFCTKSSSLRVWSQVCACLSDHLPAWLTSSFVIAAAFHGHLWIQ